MGKSLKIPLLLLRLALGWLFFYAGITKVLNSGWSAAGYLNSAKTFPGLYNWLASPAHLGLVNFLNEWGLTLIGLSLIFGFLVRWSSLAGIFMMILYYFPAFKFPYAGANGFLIDEHVIYSLVLVLIYIYSSKYSKLLP